MQCTKKINKRALQLTRSPFDSSIYVCKIVWQMSERVGCGEKRIGDCEFLDRNDDASHNIYLLNM